ncbi:MAG: preprotein translocase subunit YajC [Alphaproteobacteria bacterium]|nr:MAG: preprotein translocase subunit YajC [Alphaproteobacteria bacterium]
MYMSLTIAQATGGSQPGGLLSILPFVLIFVVFYFLLIRPQQKRAQQHQDMVKAVRRGDVVVTGGGLVGKVTKVVDDNEVVIELAEGVRVRAVKTTLSDVRSKTEPADAKASAKADTKEDKADKPE